MFIETLLLVIAGIWLGWKWREISAMRLHQKMRREQQESRIIELAERIQDSFVETTVERIGDMFYLHDADTGEFLAQGEDAEELSKNLRTRFPKKKFVMDKKSLNMIGIHNE